MRILRNCRRLGLSALLCSGAMLCGQQTQVPPSVPTTPATPTNAQLQQQIQLISSELTLTQQQLQQSQQEVQKLQQQLAAIQAQLSGGQPPSAPENAAAPATPAVPTPPTPEETAEKMDVIEAQVKVHEQSKVESVSKYPVHFTGLVLFNTFIVSGNVDNFDLPAIALPTSPTVSTLATGAGVRQTILGVRAGGPRVFGAESSAEVNMDFYGGIPYSNYNTSTGVVRLRTADVRLNWKRDTTELGFVAPLISPLEPTSYASVAEPALAWAGNLWTWAPQFSYEHRFGNTEGTHATWQVGLWDPPTSGYNADALFRAASPGERSGQPAYEMRVALVNDKRGAGGMQIGMGGYYSRQSFTGWSSDSWAVTGDWKVPVGRFFELSGEAYRGRSLGGLGGGAYKDVIYGNDPKTGASTYRLLNAGGGWAQAKFRFSQVFEANGAFGGDNANAADFHSLVFPAGTTALALRARNHMATANLIYSPKTYLIFSPEYRRIWTWPIYGTGNMANVFTMTFGLRF